MPIYDLTNHEFGKICHSTNHKFGTNIIWGIVFSVKSQFDKSWFSKSSFHIKNLENGSLSFGAWIIMKKKKISTSKALIKVLIRGLRSFA